MCEKEGERIVIFIFKGMIGALATFSYLVIMYLTKCELGGKRAENNALLSTKCLLASFHSSLFMQNDLK